MTGRRTEPFTAIHGGPKAGRLVLTLAVLILVAALTGFFGPIFL